VIVSVLLLALVTAQRFGELVVAAHNTRRLMAKGAYEASPRHYPLIVALHGAWLSGLWWLAWDTTANLVLAALFLGLEGLRAWTLASLGQRWTTRIIILPGAPLVRRGPYRFFPHPNYAVVCAETALLPLVFGLWAYALAFTALNAAMLIVRIRCEEAALRPAGGAPRSGGWFTARKRQSAG
jgi:methyltransferase